jgi:hypothetical protein
MEPQTTRRMISMLGGLVAGYVGGWRRAYPVQRKSEKVSQVMSDRALSLLSLLALMEAQMPEEGVRVLLRIATAAHVVPMSYVPVMLPHPSNAHNASFLRRSTLSPHTSVAGRNAR